MQNNIPSLVLPMTRSALRALCIIGIPATLFHGEAIAASVVVGFNFENVAAGSPTAAASTVGVGISSAVFGGTSGSAQVVFFDDNTFISGALFPNENGTEFNFFSFTTTTSLDLDSLSFMAGQNDHVPSTGDRSFEIRLSPVNAATPTGNFGIATTNWDLLSTIALTHGFGTEAVPNYDLDLTGKTIGPGTYHIAFGAQAGEINSGTAQLFMDNVTLSAIPEPTCLALLSLGAVGLLTRRRRVA